MMRLAAVEETFLMVSSRSLNMLLESYDQCLRIYERRLVEAATNVLVRFKRDRCCKQTACKRDWITIVIIMITIMMMMMMMMIIIIII